MTQREDQGDGKRTTPGESISGEGPGNEASAQASSGTCCSISPFVTTRRLCAAIAENPWFERLIVLLILMNCITLASVDPLDDTCLQQRCQVLETCEKAFTLLFLCEILLKVAALGLRTYSANGWNRLDCIIALFGLIDFIPGLSSGPVAVLRIARMLKPLRMVSRVPDLQLLVVLLLDIIPMLGSLGIVTLFLFCLFGIVGVQLWSGVLHHRCILPFDAINSSIPTVLASAIPQSPITNSSYAMANGTAPGHTFPPFANSSTLTLAMLRSVADNISDIAGPFFPLTYFPTSNYAASAWLNPHVCNPSESNACPIDETSGVAGVCASVGPNPFFGAVSFDNFLLASATIFQVITLEGWTAIMHLVQRAHSYWSWVYFVLLIFAGSWFTVNLALVVIATQFKLTKKRMATETAIQMFHKQRLMKNAPRKMRWARFVNHYASKWFGMSPVRLDDSPKDLEQHVLNNKELSPIEKRDIVTTMQVFQMFDSDGDGTISLSELSNVLKSTTQLPLHKRKLMALMEMADADGDGTIDFVEFMDLLKRSRNGSACDPANASSSERHEQEPCPSDIVPFFPAFGLRRRESQLSPVPPKEKNSHPQHQGRQGREGQEGQQGVASRQVISLFRKDCHQPTNVDGPEVDDAGDSPDAGTSRTLSAFREESVRVSQQLRHSRLSARNSWAPPLSIPLNTPKAMQRTSANLPSRPQIVLSSSSAHLTGPPTLHQHQQQQESTCAQKTPPTVMNASIFVNQGLQRRLASSIDHESTVSSEHSSVAMGNHPDCSEADYNRGEGEGDGPSSPSHEQKRSGFFALIGFCQWITLHPKSQMFIVACIAVNTMIMSIEHHNQSPIVDAITAISNYVFSIIFTMEMVVKLLGLGPVKYLIDKFNVFDGVIVIVSLIEIGTGAPGYSVLRSFRLFRVFTALRSVPTMHKQLAIMVKTLNSILTFLVLLFLFIFMASITGMQLFGKSLPTSEGQVSGFPRANFQSFQNSVILVFQVLTTEEWASVMYKAVAASNLAAIIYFIVLITLGTYILINLFIAIMVEGFATNPEALKRFKEAILQTRRVMKSMSSQDILSQPTPPHSPPLPATTRTTTTRSLLRVHKTDHPSPLLRSQLTASPTAYAVTRAPRLHPLSPVPLSSCHPGSAVPPSRLSPLPPIARVRGTNGMAASELVDASRAILLTPVPLHSNRFAANLQHVSDDFLLSFTHELPQQALHPSRPRSVPLYRPAPRRQPFSPQLWQQEGRAFAPSRGGDCIDDMNDPDNHGNPGIPRMGSSYPCQESSLFVDLRVRASDHPPLDGNAACLRPSAACSHASCASRAARAVVGHPLFDAIIVCAILVSSLLMIWDTPTASAGVKNKLEAMHFGLVILFTAELVIKAFAGGIFQKEGGLLRSGWNLLDVFVVVTSWLYFALTQAGLTASFLRTLRVLRALRTLRPLRMINHLPQLKQTVRTLYLSIKPLSSVLVIELVFFMIFGILGVQLFRGRLFSCTASSFVNATAPACVLASLPPLSLSNMTSVRFENGSFLVPSVGTEDMCTVMQEQDHEPFWNATSYPAGHTLSTTLTGSYLSTNASFFPTRFAASPSGRADQPLPTFPWLLYSAAVSLFAFSPGGLPSNVTVSRTAATAYAPLVEGLRSISLVAGHVNCSGCIFPVVDEYTCSLSGGAWENAQYNFDNLASALMTLFVVSTRDGWVAIMTQVSDATGVEMQPSYRANQTAVLYFIAFVMVVGYFVLNMFVGVLVENFQRSMPLLALEEAEQKPRLAGDQHPGTGDNLCEAVGRRYLLAHAVARLRGRLFQFARRAACLNSSKGRRGAEQSTPGAVCSLEGVAVDPDRCDSPARDDNASTSEEDTSSHIACDLPLSTVDEKPSAEGHSSLRCAESLFRVCQRVDRSFWFSALMTGLIAVNIVLMMAEHYGQPDWFGRLLALADTIFIACFVGEAIIKVTASGMQGYLSDGWNLLDLFVVVTSVAGTVLELMEEQLPINTTILRVLRILRVVRVFKLMRVAVGVRSLLLTVSRSTSHVGNLSVLLLLLFYISAAMAVELFGRIGCTAAAPCLGLNEFSHFRDIGSSMLTLFQVSTGDNWGSVLQDVLREPPYCDPSAECVTNCCANSHLSTVFFSVFVILAQFILLNVVVAVLMKHLTDAMEQHQDEKDEDSSVAPATPSVQEE